jgi:hypothetical protein
LRVFELIGKSDISDTDIYFIEGKRAAVPDMPLA